MVKLIRLCLPLELCKDRLAIVDWGYLDIIEPEIILRLLHYIGLGRRLRKARIGGVHDHVRGLLPSAMHQRSVLELFHLLLDSLCFVKVVLLYRELLLALKTLKLQSHGF